MARKHSYAFCGGAFGDEGKGRIVDWFVNARSEKSQVIVYRDNGGANAGHTIEVGKTRIALHQLPSGILCNNTTLVLGKCMVIHPADLCTEIKDVEKLTKKKLSRKIKIDESAYLSLDTHRAYEAVLKQWEEGGKGSTGRGISPAYADVLLRHPVRMRDLVPFNKKKLSKHYDLYAALVKGLGQDLAQVEVPVLDSSQKVVKVGSKQQFVSRLQASAKMLAPMIGDVHHFVSDAWKDKDFSFVFEKAQAVGLDARWGVYPDITASDTTFDGIFSASEGSIDPEQIEIKAAVIKATYMSSVGSRKLPSAMSGALADRIREDANEYGATTRRPRDIAYLDLAAIKYFLKVGRVSHLVLTHMDIVYPDQPVRVCVGYQQKRTSVEYRPDQAFLDTVAPVFEELSPWDVEKLHAAKTVKDLPVQAKRFIRFLEKQLGVPVIMITTGPERDQTLFL